MVRSARFAEPVGSRIAWRTVVGAVLLLTIVASGPALAQSRPTFTIGVSVDDSPENSTWLLELLRSECTALMQQEFDLSFPPEKTLGAGGTLDGARRAHDALLADDGVDLVIALGPLVSTEMVGRSRLPTPAIAPLVLDVFVGRLPRGEGGGSGVPGLCYVEPVFDFAHDVQRYRQLVDFRRLAVFGPGGLLAAVAPRVDEELPLDELDLQIVPIVFDGDVEAAMAAWDASAIGADAAYLIGPTPDQRERFAPLLEALHARGVPTFSTTGEIGVRAGALAGLTPADWWPRLMRRTALDVRHVLAGDPAEEIPVQLTRNDRLYLNMSTARRLGVSPSFDLMSDAELIGDLQREPARTLDLPDAMREALARNRDVATARRELEAGRQDVRIARAALLPQLEASLGSRWIDEDRAEQATAGAQTTLAASASLSQVLWSERAWSGVTVQRHLVRSLEASLREQELDVALEVASAYFDVLSALAVERIRRDNLRRTRTNLERARVRQRLGAASPAEEYRWESQVAQDQDALVTSIAQRNLAEIELNRVLHLPLEEKLGVVEPEQATDVFRYLDPRFLPYIDDPASLRMLRSHVSDVAKENSPELARIDALLEVQRRLLASENRSFFSPDVALTGELTHTLDRSGEGADLLDMAPIDDTDWELRLGLGLPLLQGGERLARRGQLAAEIARLEHQREAIAERVEQRVRSTIHVASASFTRIGLTDRARRAAAQNFELVSDAYAEGAVSIVELIDAQTAYFNAQQQAASAAYQFLADVMEVERASGDFLVLATDAEKDAVFDRLEARANTPRQEQGEN